MSKMEGFSLWKQVESAQGLLSLPNTYASVDHPFHVARADTLWRELASGHVLRWIGQHQGGYPVEFYPLGEAWFEVAIRALSLNSLSPEGAHTLGVIALFLLPGAAYFALARQDKSSPSVAFLAISLQIALPGGWYGGGYTELVQWGLVTNVAGATASILALPALITAITRNSPCAMALAAGLSAIALYCNPRSAIGLVAIGIGVLVASLLERGPLQPRIAVLRLLKIAGISGLLAAPLLMSLARFGGLYSFVHYSDYASFSDFLNASRDSVSSAVLVLGLAGLAVGLWRGRRGTRATALSAGTFILATTAVAFIPLVDAIIPQLEPTRLMPLQRYLLIYLAAGLIYTIVTGISSRRLGAGASASAIVLVTASILIVAFQTRPILEVILDPASSEVPPVSLYAVAMSAQPQQASLESAVRAADRNAAGGTAILVLGSVLSWHQQLWAPLWTERLLFYDNWLWYWHLKHAGTPGYRPHVGHHYPDPEATLTREYLDRHGIGAVVTSSALRDKASESSFLSLVADGTYLTYVVENSNSIVTFDNGNTTFASADNSGVEAHATLKSTQAAVRVN